MEGRMKFIHAADLHIDSPLEGLVCYEGAPAERLREATRRALENLVSLAIEENVDFVIIAGDLFDGPWRNVQTGLFTARQFRRLEDAGTRVYLIRGNHDAESQVRQAITWPDNVHEFSVRKAETVQLDDLGVAIHGRGFAQREVLGDPVQEYPDPVQGMFNIGVLHTNVDGSPGHDPYAPTSLSVLQGKGYDYWALGHIHKRQTISQRPYIAYCGNLQGRHVKETEPKGCLLVTVDQGELVEVAFHPTDVVRWYAVEISLNETDGLPELYAAVQTRLQECHRQSDDRLSAVRLAIRGRCDAYRALVHAGQREEVIGEIRNQANALDEDVWVEDVRLEIDPPVDLDQLRLGQDLLGDLLRHIDHVGRDPMRLASLVERLAVVEKHHAGALEQAGIRVQDTEQVKTWLRQAEGLLVAHLLTGENE
jgi:exonuclease SbcD